MIAYMGIVERRKRPPLLDTGKGAFACIGGEDAGSAACGVRTRGSLCDGGTGIWDDVVGKAARGVGGVDAVESVLVTGETGKPTGVDVG